jgi:hypothetical protein
MKFKLNSHQLAEAYSILLRRRFPVESGGQVWASYVGGGWIEMRGTKLAAKPSLRGQFPNGWELLDRIRCRDARKELIEALG